MKSPTKTTIQRWALCSFFALFSCGGKSTKVSNARPEGTIGGLVVNASTHQPLEGVKVTVIAGGVVLPKKEPAVTDSDGRFAIDDVPAGQVIVRFAGPDGFSSGDSNVTLENSAGFFPVNNATLSLGPIGLIPLTKADDSIKVQLVNKDGSTPKGIRAQLHASLSWIDFSGDQPRARGLTVVEATSNDQGMLEFSGIPDFFSLAGYTGTVSSDNNSNNGSITDALISDEVRISVPATDQDGDGIFDIVGSSTKINVNRPANATTPTLILDVPSSVQELKVVGSTNLTNRLLGNPDGPFFVAFNVPVDGTLSTVELFDEVGTPVSGDRFQADFSGSFLTLTFNGLGAGKEYNLKILAVSVQPDERQLRLNWQAPFFTPSAGEVQIASIEQQANDPRSFTVTFSEPIGKGDGSSSSARVYLEFDRDKSTVLGDYRGETPGGDDYTASPLTLVKDEPSVPTGQSSGYSSTWTFTVPRDSLGSSAGVPDFTADLPVGQATTVHLVFSGSGIERPNEETVQNLIGQVVPTIEPATSN